MSLAAETREAARARPFVLDALRAGVLNHSAAAAWLADEAGLDGDPTRSRDRAPPVSRGTVRLRDRRPRGQRVDAERSGGRRRRQPRRRRPLLRVGGAAVVPEGRDTAILATGTVDAAALAAVLRRLAAADVAVEAAGVAGETLVVVVGRRDGAIAVRIAEASLAVVPSQED